MTTLRRLLAWLIDAVTTRLCGAPLTGGAGIDLDDEDKWPPVGEP